VPGFEFKFDRSGFENPKIMEKKLGRAILGVARYWDGRVEAHMKHSAPWTDRTSNARNGLKAEAHKVDSMSAMILLTHGVTYGIYLEEGTRNMAARPIIRPTIEEYAPRVMATLTKILNRLGGG
jgi:HK97 gp10 family phage protein